MDSPSPVAAPALDAAAERLLTAARTGVPCAPVRELIGSGDLAAAYAVQSRITAARLAAGATVVGRKIGLTSEAVQRQIGVDQPDFGVLFDDMAYADGAAVPHGAVLQPKAEAEVAFVLGADLAEGELDLARVRAAIDHAVAAIEVCGSRVAGWDITFADTVADNASSGVYVLGSQRRTLAGFEPAEVTMSMTVDGTEVSTGTGAACLGDPLNAVLWLARTAREFGEPLRAGQVVLSGALGPMAAIPPGARVTVTISGLGSVSATFPGEEQA
ncbi:2-keto-4-pentenoate hydratase [Blastococcus sp. SYSU D00820]